MPARTAIAAAGAAAGLLSLLGAPGCSDPLEPGQVLGIYALQSVAGAPLPAVLSESDYSRVVVTRDRLRLNADGTGHRSTRGVAEPLGETMGMPSQEVRWEIELRFEIVDRRIEIEFVCPPNALCTPPPHMIARRVREGLLVESAGLENTPLLYVPLTIGTGIGDGG